MSGPINDNCGYHRLYSGNINLMDNVRGVNKEIDGLPKLEGYTKNDARSIICLNWCLGICIYDVRDKCHFMHVTMEYITGKVVSELCQAFSPGVQHVLRHGYMEQGLTKKEHKG